MFLTNGGPLRGRLRVDLPTELARSVVAPALSQLMAIHPELRLELSSTDRRVDLVQGNFDYVIRFGPITDETMIARSLSGLRITNAVSPTYLERYGAPHTLEDLLSQGYQMVHYALTPGTKHAGQQCPDSDSYVWLPLSSAIRVGSVQTYRAAGLTDVRLIQTGYTAPAPHIQSGALMEALPRLRPKPLSASFVITHRHNLSPHVRVFMAWIEGLLKPHPD